MTAPRSAESSDDPPATSAAAALPPTAPPDGVEAAPPTRLTHAPTPALHVPGAEGVEVAGYEVRERIGKGGMGVVYRARQLELDREVALKMILHAEHAGPDERE